MKHVLNVFTGRAVCGVQTDEFDTDATCRRCNPVAHTKAAGTERRKEHARTARAERVLQRHIIAWDGEGLESPDGVPQRYVLLANSDGYVTANSDGIRSSVCLGALIQSARDNPGALHFIYGGGYDVNQFLQDVDEKTLRTLWETGACYWNGYHLLYRPRKMFYVKHIASGIKVTLWDAFPWYQTSFVAALEKNIPGYPDLDFIREMKARRSQFSFAEYDDILRYCRTELSALVTLIRDLLARLQAADIRVRRYDGPGAAAAALLRQHGVQRHKGDTPPEVRYAGAVAYSGGRIEPVQYGNLDAPVHHYDINSAYPYAMTLLPTLRGATWTHETSPDADAIQDAGLYRIAWQESGALRPFYPFPFRTDDGSIYYPPEGASWIYGPELRAYLDNADAFPSLDVRIEEAYLLRPPNDEKPFEFVAGLYEYRQQLKRRGDGAEWAIKLGLNSMYGKLAQTLGWTETKIPPYYQLEWAGLITSYTRAQLFRAAIQEPDGIIAFATDGILSTVPLSLPISKALGKWDYQQHDGVTLVQSGVYFLRDGDEWKIWTRGYNKGEIDREQVLAGWSAQTPSVSVPQTRFITLGSALAGRTLARDWRSWRTHARVLSLYPTGKRIAHEMTTKPATELARSLPAYALGMNITGMSQPYSRVWRDGVNVETIDGVPAETYEQEVRGE